MKTILIATLLMGTATAEQLRVTVYDKAGLSAHDLKRTFDNLRAIFRHSEIDIDWVTGAPDAGEATYISYSSAPPRDRELEAECRARRDIALSIIAGAPPSLHQAILGMAQPLASDGVNVRVYNDHIAAQSRSRDQEHTDILSHAIAHEIGHVLLRSSAHDGHGLMAGVWTSREYGLIATRSMFFSAEESKKMRASISGIGCPARYVANRRNPGADWPPASR